ncbi:MAG: phosphoglycerate kinase [Oscillospiraceae bacterium]|jgi:3-phosphoglycerate kinase|nr:phosphoglycerate kinase [Oscillospiraceae bacterium]
MPARTNYGIDFDKQSISDTDVRGKKILLRCDFNIPLDRDTGAVTDDGRIIAALPTIRYLLDQGAAVIACSHLGRPGGVLSPEFSLKVVGERLTELLGKPVKISRDAIGEDSRRLAASLQPGEIMLLENLRFYPGEELNDPEFARALAALADVFVEDAFGSVHRAHASIEGVSHFLPAVAGFLLEQELRHIGGALENPKPPFIAILGGSKVSDKIGVIDNLLDKADTLIIGGGMAYTFLKARDGSIGSSLCENDRLQYARDMLVKAQRLGVRLLLPVDSLVAQRPDNSLNPDVVNSYNIPDDMMALDIGPKAANEFVSVIKDAGTVIWNGPMGIFELPKYSNGTRMVAIAMTDPHIVSIVGGGDSAAAIRQFGLEGRVTHVSTGGGATLEFLEGRELPGVACLLDKPGRAEV